MTVTFITQMPCFFYVVDQRILLQLQENQQQLVGVIVNKDLYCGFWNSIHLGMKMRNDLKINIVVVINICFSIHSCELCIYIFVFVYLCIGVFVNLCICVFMYLYIYVFVYLYLYIYVFVFVYLCVLGVVCSASE